MYMKFMIYIIFIFSAIFSQCPEGFVLDDCQECWQPYCYCLSDHIPNFDISQSDCENDGCWWIGPGGAYEPGDYEFCLFNPEWNQSCTGCTDPQALNYNINATISCDDNCNGEAGDCCEYILNNQIKEIPQNSLIKSAYPNPFNPNINIGISISTFEFLDIEIFDLSGKKVSTLYSDHTMPGSYIFNWDASDYQTGIYILKVSSGQNIETQLINFIK